MAGSGTSRTIRIFRASAKGVKKCAAVSATCTTSTGADWRCSSGFAAANTELDSAIRRLVSRSIISSDLSRSSSLRVRPSRMSWTNIRICCSGVRSSCETLARNRCLELTRRISLRSDANPAIARMMLPIRSRTDAGTRDCGIPPATRKRAMSGRRFTQ